VTDKENDPAPRRKRSRLQHALVYNEQQSEEQKELERTVARIYERFKIHPKDPTKPKGS